MVDVAVIPAAGWGTRFLPATKAVPKELLPVGSKPVIQYAVEEAARAGIRHVVIVGHSAKTALENHFDFNAELNSLLASRNKQDLLAEVSNVLPASMHVSVVRQGLALGLGHAVACAEPIVGNRSFAVILPDDLLLGRGETLRDMVALHDKHGVSSISVEEVPLEATKSYGIVSTERGAHGLRIADIVEKPDPAVAPSRLAVVGRYVLPGSIFSALRETKPGAGGEIQLTDAIKQCLPHQHFVAHRFSDRRFDCGSQWGFLSANVYAGMQNPEVASQLRDLIMTNGQS